MEVKTLKQVQTFVKKNPFPSYEFVENMLLKKAKRWNEKGDRKHKHHYLSMYYEYEHDNHEKLKEIYENIEKDELIKKHGCDIVESRTQRTLHYNHFAICEILQHLITDKSLVDGNTIYHGIKLQIENNWEEYLQ